MARPSMQGEILHPPNLLLPRTPERGRHQVVERKATVVFLDTFARKNIPTFLIVPAAILQVFPHFGLI